MPQAIVDINVDSKDEEIVQAYLATRHQSYFDILYQRYSAKIYGRCISLLNDEALAQDAVQDIFVKIVLNLSKFNEKSRFSTWVYSIAYNWCIDIIRKRKKRLKYEQTEDVEDYELMEEVEDRELMETEVSRLKIVLEQLPEEDKAILLMKYLEEMSIVEISDAMMKSDSAVKMRIKRAKHKFKKIYHQHFKD